MPYKFKIKAEQSRNYGNVQQLFSVETEISVEKPADRKSWYNALNLIIEEEFVAFEQNYFPGDNPKSDESLISWEDGTIIASMRDGKLLPKLKTGEFNKWGIPIYPEVWDKLELPPGMDFPIDAKGWKGKILTQDGKPKKVVEIVCRFSS